jgi:hypothetical protein
MMGISLAGGAGIFGAFLIVFTLAVVYSLYTRRGSGINQRPWNSPYGGAPGARGASVLHHDESAATRYTRGTRAAGTVRPRQSSGQPAPKRRIEAGRPLSEAAEEIFKRS